MRHIHTLLAVLLLCGAASADLVTARDGREWKGTLTSVRDTMLVFQKDGDGELILPRSQIEKIVFPEFVMTSSGRRTVDRSGRVELAVYGTTAGIVDGFMLSAILEPGDVASSALSLAGGIAGFAGSWSWSRSRSVSDSRAWLMTYMGSWGMWQGIGWPLTLADDPSHKVFLATGMLGQAVGVIASGIISADDDIPAGDVTLITSLPGWTSIYWLYTAAMLDIRNEKTILGTTLMAGNVGILAGAMLARRMDVSRTKVRLTNIGGTLGAVAGGLVLATVNVENGRVASSILMGTTTAGMLLAWRMSNGGGTSEVSSSTFEMSPTMVISRLGTFSGAHPGVGARWHF
jgi:hypothetical protein